MQIEIVAFVLAEIGICRTCDEVARAFKISLTERAEYKDFEPLAVLLSQLGDGLRRGGRLIVANADAAFLPSVAAVYLWGGGRTALEETSTTYTRREFIKSSNGKSSLEY